MSSGFCAREGTLNPVWDETFTFDFDWPRDWKPQKVVESGGQRVQEASLTLRRANSSSHNLTGSMVRKSKSQVGLKRQVAVVLLRFCMYAWIRRLFPGLIRRTLGVKTVPSDAKKKHIR